MDRRQYLLSKLAEEASEISQISLKCQQFGMDDRYPDKDSNKNSTKLGNELTDLWGIVAMLVDEGHLGFLLEEEKIIKKVQKVNRYYDYALKRGQIQERENV